MTNPNAPMSVVASESSYVTAQNTTTDNKELCQGTVEQFLQEALIGLGLTLLGAGAILAITTAISAVINRIRVMGDVELPVGDTTKEEMKSGKIIFRGTSLSVRRSSPQYQELLRVLEAKRVGGTKANASKDRTIVADTFFAQKELGVIPKLATQDTGIYNNLARMAHIYPETTAAGIAAAYPSGFDVTINGKTIRVIPIPNK